MTLIRHFITRFGTFIALTITMLGMALLVACTDSKPTITKPEPLNIAELRPSTITLETFRGHWVFLDFWASWCLPCLDSFPWLESMNSKYGDRMQFITINQDTNAAARTKFIEQMGVSLPVIVDEQGQVMRRFEVNGLPTSLIISPSGIIIHRQEGFLPERQEYYERIIRLALGLDADVATTQATDSNGGGY